MKSSLELTNIPGSAAALFVHLYFDFGISEYNDAFICLPYNYSVGMKCMTSSFHFCLK